MNHPTPRFLAAVLTLALFATGCASKQSPESGTSADDRIELPVEPELAVRLFGGRAPLVFKYHPGKWKEVREAVESRFPEIRRAGSYRRLREPGPLAFFARHLGVERLERLVDRERAIYVRVGYLGTRRATMAGTFGMALAPSDRAPSGLYVRGLVPTEAPNKALKQVRNDLEKLPDGMYRRVQKVGSHLQIDAVMARDGEPRDDLKELFEETASGSGAEEVPTPTPTMVRFLQADAAAAYTDLADLRVFSYARFFSDSIEALPGASPENRLKLIAVSMSTMLNLGLVNPAHLQSYVDAALTFGTDGADGLVVDLHQTRTKYGAEVRDRTADELFAPSFDDAAFEKTTPLFRASGALDVTSLAAMGTDTPFADFEDRTTVDLDSLARGFRAVGIWGYAGFLSAPEHFLYLLSAGMAESRQVGFPLPSAVSVRLAVDPNAQNYPLVGGLALRFEASEQERRRIRNILGRKLVLAASHLPVQVGTAFEAVGDEGFRATLGLQRSAEQLSIESRKTPAGIDATFDPSAAADLLERFGEGGRGGSLGAMLRTIGEVRVETAASRVERRVRLGIGLDEPEDLETTSRAKLRPRPRTSDCLSKLRLETIELFKGLEDVSGDETEVLRQVVDRYDRTVDKCRSVEQKARKWARGRWRWLIAEIVANSVRGRADLLRTCSGESKAAKEERRRTCKELVRKRKDAGGKAVETYVAKTDRMTKFATKLYDESCSLGDDAGCLGKSQDFADVPGLGAVQKGLVAWTESSEKSKSSDEESSNPEVSMNPTDVRVNGELDKEVIRKIVGQHRREIRYCYEKELEKGPDLEGVVRVQFTISPKGEVVAALVTKSTIANPDLDSCIREKVKRWVFPEPEGGIVKVNFPFEFSSGD